MRATPPYKRDRNLIAGLAAACLLLAIRPALAQLTLVPPIREVSLRPGASVVFPVQISNAGKEALTCEMSGEDMELSAVGRPQTATEGYTRGCGGWVSFKPARFEFGAGQSQKVACTLRAPRGTSGGYYARLRCLARPGRGAEPIRGGAITFEYQMSCALLATVTSGRLHSNISAKSIQLSTNPGRARASGSPAWAARVAVRNTGNVHAMLEGRVSILDEHGRAMARAPLLGGRGYVLAGGERVFQSSGSEHLPDGVYALAASLHLAGRRSAPTIASVSFTILKGEVHQGEPSPESRALLASLNPGFYLERPTVEFALSPGGKRRELVPIVNRTDQPIELAAELREWELDAQGELTFPPGRPGHGRSCAGWLRVEPPAVTLPPRGRARVALQITMPKQVHGEYYAAVEFKRPDQTKSSDSAALIAGSVLVTARARRTEKPEIQVASFALPKQTPRSTTFRLSVRNCGNVECFAEGRVAVLDSRRRVVVENLQFGSEQQTLMPNGVRTFEITWPGALSPGPHTAVIALNYYRGTTALAKEVSFAVPASPKRRS